MGVVTKSTSYEFLVHYSPSDGHRQTKCDELISGWGKAAIKAAIQYPKTPTAHSPRQWGSGRRMWQPPPLRWKCVRNAAASAAAFVRDLPRNHVNNLSSAYSRRTRRRIILENIPGKACVFHVPRQISLSHAFIFMSAQHWSAYDSLAYGNSSTSDNSYGDKFNGSTA